MININELMIGSVVSYMGKAYQVRSLDPEKEYKCNTNPTLSRKGVIGIDDQGFVDPITKWAHDFEPIPLTVDVLDALKMQNNRQSKDSLLMIFIAINVLESLFGKRPKYVHDLQRLVFSLSGKPLDVSALLTDKTSE